MLYKPRFCCHCGQKITRIEWNLLTSRRFCEVCAEENKSTTYIQRGLISAGILGTVFGIGSIFGGASADRANAPAEAPVALKSAAPVAKDQLPPTNFEKQTQSPVAVSPQPTAEAERQIASREAPKSASVFQCGAMTKKGTACSRRVKASGDRCYQHEGKPSVLTED